MGGGALRSLPSVLLAGLLVAVLAPPGPARAQGSFGGTAPSATEGRRVAILIGTDNYSDPNLQPLGFAAKDAQDLGEVLSDPARGGFATVKVVPEEERTAAGIMMALQRWKRGVGPEDTALIYFSGHGMRWVDERNRSRVFLAASDTVRDDPLNTAIPVEAVQQFLESLPAGRRVLIIDTCFTGDGKVDSENAVAAARAYLDEKLPLEVKVDDKEAQLFSTTYGRPAMESKKLQNGIYTGNLIDALGDRFDEADLDGDFVVTVSEAHDYARDRTMERTDGVQVPMVFYRIVGREDVVLSGDATKRRRVELAFVSAYEGAQEGLRMFVDGRERGSFPRSVLVEPGAHSVEFRTLAGKVVDRGRFEFAARGVYSVRAVRDSLGGGRHLVSAGYAHTWLPGESYATESIPSGPGFRLAYGFRFPSRNPLIRRLGLAADLTVGFFPSQATTPTDLGDSPSTTLLDLGGGPMMRLDLPRVLLSVQPRLALVVLLREDSEQPFLNWVFGAVGVDLSAGFRPVNRLSIQVHYTPMLFNAALQGEAKTELMSRLAVVVELGF